MSEKNPDLMSVRELRANLKQALLLLSLARCPNAHCVDGVIQEGFDEVFQCQWCHERKEMGVMPS